MDLLFPSPRLLTTRARPLHYSSLLRRNLFRVRFTIRSRLPFSPDIAKYHKEIEAAIDVVDKACRLCVDVKKSLFSTDGGILEKNDLTPVTVADFGVQALISLELNRLFPSIPLVAEEDSTFLRSTAIADTVVNAVDDKVSAANKPLTQDIVLKAIDRGGRDAYSFGAGPATYWVLDPIDGTRGFLKGSEALYVVGLALIVEGKIALGVMGCPNWQEEKVAQPGPGLIMISHIGCGTWTRWISNTVGSMKTADIWCRRSVDKCFLVHEARFCISDSQNWESLPLSTSFSATITPNSVEVNQILLLPTCCGSLCKYLMVASGRASVFIMRAKAKTSIKAWDHAVGVICVNEAGGQVTDWEGSELDLGVDQIERRIIFPSGGILVTNGPWTSEEDQKLIDYIHKHGHGSWRTLPKNAGLERCGKSCRLRWTNYLRPDIKRGRFSFEEEETIIQLHSALGNKWSAIAARLPGRTDNEIKNYWNTHIRKRLLRMGIDPVTHSPRVDLLDLSSLFSSSLYNTSQLNVSRLLGLQTVINPELLMFASTLLSSQQKSLEFSLLQNLQDNKLYNFQFHNQEHFHPFQAQVHQQHSSCTPSLHSTFVNEVHNMQSNFEQFQSNSNSNLNSENCQSSVWQDSLHGDLFKDFNQSSLIDSLFDEMPDLPSKEGDDNFNRTSILSTTPSSSPAPLNSSSTYVSTSSTTEEDSDSYCSNMIEFIIPDLLEINDFIS